MNKQDFRDWLTKQPPVSSKRVFLWQMLAERIKAGEPVAIIDTEAQLTNCRFGIPKKR